MATLDETYQELQDRIVGQQKLIVDLLKEHKVGFTDRGHHWGYPGDLAHISRSLAHVIRYLSVPGPDREFEELAKINGDEK